MKVNWNEEFLVLKRVRSYYHLQLAMPLDIYHSQINEFAGIYTTIVWFEYDKRFKQLRPRDFHLADEKKQLSQNLLNSPINRYPGRATIPLCRIWNDIDHNQQQ